MDAQEIRGVFPNITKTYIMGTTLFVGFTNPTDRDNVFDQLEEVTDHVGGVVTTLQVERIDKDTN